MPAVTPVLSVAGTDKPQSTTLHRIHRLAKKPLKPLKGAKAIGGIFRQAAGIAGLFKDLSKSLQVALHISKGPNIILGLVSIKHAVDDVRKIIDKSKKPGDRLKASLLFVTHMDSVVNTAATVCKILSAAGTIGKHAVQWIPIFGMISFAVGFISLGLGAHSTHKSRKLVNAFNDSMKEYQQAATHEAKATALAQALAVIDSEGIQPLRKQLMISKKGGIELVKRVDALRDHIASHSVTEQDVNLVKILAGRATTQLRYKAADLASSVGAIVGGAFFLVPVPVAAQATGAAILAATGVVSLVAWGGRYFFINKDPFDENSKNRAMELLDDVSKALRLVKQRLQMVALGKRRAAHAA